MTLSFLGRKTIVGGLAVLFLVSNVLPAVANETPGAIPTTQLFVEFKDVQPADTALSDRAPREYRVNGKKQRARDLRRWRVIAVPTAEVGSVTEKLENNPAVKSIHEEQIYTAALLPNDPQFSEQYGLLNVENSLADINAPAAWERTTGSEATVIAVVDGGVDLTHEDLQGKMWSNADEVAGNGVDDDGNGFVDDHYGWDFVADAPAEANSNHGTHVAGIAAASANNGLGITGVNWGARIMSVRVLSGNGVGREEGIIRGVEYAVANGADIINMSIVGPSSAALRDAIENAYASGVVVVAAAGNSGNDTGRSNPFPACADQGSAQFIVGVGATDEQGEPASFSNYGDCVDISAPGKNILSTKADDNYGTMTGTSMSSPLVAGVAGLYVALHPQASPAEVLAAVMTGQPFTSPDAAEATEWNADYAGRLDAAAVVGAANTQGENNSTPTPVATPNEGDPVKSPTSSAGGPDGDHGAGGGNGGGGGGGDSGNSSEPEPVVKKPKVAGAVSTKANVALLKRVKLTFNHVFGRLPTPAERLYWDTRVKRGDKKTYPALLGAMQWQKAQGWAAGAKNMVH